MGGRGGWRCGARPRREYEWDLEADWHWLVKVGGNSVENGPLFDMDLDELNQQMQAEEVGRAGCALIGIKLVAGNLGLLA